MIHTCPTCEHSVKSSKLYFVCSCSTQAKRVNAWLPLHQYAADHCHDWDGSAARTFFDKWNASVFGCGPCKTHWTSYTAANPPDFASADAFFAWGVHAHNHVSVHHVRTPKPAMTLEDAKRLYRAPHAATDLQHVITWDQFTRDILTLSQVILNDHPDVSGIAGVPRSGMRVACDIAIRLGVPLYEASATNGLRYMGGGSRIRSTAIHGTRKNYPGPIVLVDDSTCSGGAIREISNNSEIATLPKYVVYAASPGRSLVDGYAVHHELPHWFDWNLFGNGLVLTGANVGIDFDGVLGEDCLPEDDDDGPRYTTWLNALRPIRTPRDFTVPFIITARREAYRDLTEAWLERYRIQYGQLVMFPGTFAERGRTDIGQWKAEQCDRVGVGIFIESCYWQAKRIAELRKKLTISIAQRPI